jgi:hypothetical protein
MPNFLVQLLLNLELQKLQSMNSKQLINLLAPILVGATATMAKSWGIDPVTWQNDLTEWVTDAFTIGLLIYNHFRHASPAGPAASAGASGSLKALLIFALCAGVLTLGQTRALCQTNSQGFGTTAEQFAINVWQWGTSVNTNSMWQPATAWTCPVWNAAGSTIANETGASYALQFGDPQNGFFAGPETRIRAAGTPGTLVSTGGGARVGYEYYDIQVGGYLDGGYGSLLNRGYFEAGGFFDKMLTQNTATGIFGGWNSASHGWLFGGNLTITFGNGSGVLGMF